MRRFLTSCEPKVEKVIIESVSAAVETYSIRLVVRTEDMREEFYLIILQTHSNYTLQGKLIGMCWSGNRIIYQRQYRVIEHEEIGTLEDNKKTDC